jgi:hypothetical protein
MMDGPSQVAPAQPSPRQVVLGLFILGQLGFLVLANALGFYQGPREDLPPEIAPVVERVLPGYANRSGQAWTGPDEVATALMRWSELTGQPQNWSLFAPEVYKVTGFPALLLVDTDATQIIAPLAARSPFEAAVLAAARADPGATIPPLDVDLFRSDNEPADLQHFARLGHFRLRRFESILIPYLSQRDGETLAAARVRWADAIRDHVARYGDAILHYLQWRLAAYRQRHPERPDPRQVILVERTFAILPPGDAATGHWHGPRTTPIARWRPHAQVPQHCRLLECYNPATARFEIMPK